MNKFKKIASVVVATVMAGSMMTTLFGCDKTPKPDDGNGPDDNPPVVTGPGAWEGDAKYAPKLAEDNTLTYDKASTELNVNVCNSNTTTSFSEISGTVTLPDGKQYNQNDMKPAWQALKTKLGVKSLKDVSKGEGSDAQIENAINEEKLAEYDILTGSANAIMQNTDKFLNLNEYLQYMPNYASFLAGDAVTQYALKDVEGNMYYAPYYDGNNDIEKYAMTNKNWVVDILDATDLSAATQTFKGQAAAKGMTGEAYAKAWMGTADWEVDTTDPANVKNVIKLNVKYSAALTNAELKAAYKEAAGKDYAGTSGNIVDIMNQLIADTNGEVTGAQLTKLLQCYVDAVYQKADGSKFYAKRSDVFNSASAGWDVDLYTAMTRCIVTSYGLLSGTTYNGYTTAEKDIFGLTARQGTTQRRVDLVAMAGELYGVRGLESRNENTYIDANGNLKDARQDEDSYNAMAAIANLTKEGLVYMGTGGDGNGAVMYSKDKSPMCFMMHDYAQTQSKTGIKETDKSVFNIAPIVTPVSKWDTNDDGTHETIMRFTESWRSVKNTGFCVPKAAVENKPDKLSAVLALIDYFFSNDGQLLMTYGERDTTNNSDKPDGWWYGTPSTLKLEDVATEVQYTSANLPKQYQLKDAYKDQCFIYEGNVYTGTPYNGTQVPTMTTANMNFYLGKEVNGFTQGKGNLEKLSASGNYTNYARYALGTTLPIGNKNQGFEYQCTAQCALDGAAIVNIAIQNKTLKHVKLTLEEGDTLWYQIVPVTFPLTTNQQESMKGDLAKITGNYFLNSSKTDVSRTNTYIALIYYGFDTTKYIGDQETLGLMKADAKTLIEQINNDGLKQRVEILSAAWNTVAAVNGIK